jgi:hypothetical protein
LAKCNSRQQQNSKQCESFHFVIPSLVGEGGRFLS